MERDNRNMPNPNDYQRNDNIHEVNIGDFNYTGMRIYGSNVTLMRAIPDIIDGFKPVERRILYATAFIAKALKKKKKALAIIGSVIMILLQILANRGKILIRSSRLKEITVNLEMELLLLLVILMRKLVIIVKIVSLKNGTIISLR